MDPVLQRTSTSAFTNHYYMHPYKHHRYSTLCSVEYLWWHCWLAGLGATKMYVRPAFNNNTVQASCTQTYQWTAYQLSMSPTPPHALLERSGAGEGGA